MKLFNYLREKYYQWRRFYKDELYYNKQGLWVDINWYRKYKTCHWYGSIATYLGEKEAGRLLNLERQKTIDKIMWGK